MHITICSQSADTTGNVTTTVTRGHSEVCKELKAQITTGKSSHSFFNQKFLRKGKLNSLIPILGKDQHQPPKSLLLASTTFIICARFIVGLARKSHSSWSWHSGRTTAQAGLQHVGRTAATTAHPECSCPTGVRLESLRHRHADSDPAALAAGQLQNKVQAVQPRPCYPIQSQPGVSDGNSPVSRRQQITFRATLIFHLIDGLLSTTGAHEVRRAGIRTCGSCHLERSARPHPHCGRSCQVPKTAEITLF